ncbi:MAG: hypothetical protein QGI83_16105, partial [Candidatus Latescibacteria bacterium]|nr:hypothetical protein [Candidatus Latescibacterota bacterium]
MGTPFSDPIHETDLTAGVCIVAPQGETYQSAARDLAAVLSGTGCSDVEVLPDDTQALAGRHAIALGNMMDNALLRELYFRAYDFTDRAWPGPGGWAIRTVPYSLPDVGHAIVVGVSQGDDVLEASKALAGAVADGGPVMPTQYRVYQGQWADLYEGPAQDRLEKGVEDLEAGVPFGAGDWTYMRSISEIGVLAAQTGSGDLIRTFCRLVSNFVRIRWFERDLPDPPCIHGFLRALLLPFAAIEHHPGIPSSLREETLESLLGIYRSAEGAGNLGFLAHVGTERVRQNHQTRSGLDLFYGGRYFHQVHGLMEGLAWMKLADVFFAPQMASNKPVCDSWGHQWAASLCNTADYALACGRADYFTSTPYLEGVDRALIAHSLLEGGPVHYFLVAAAATGNDEYLWPCGVSGEYQLVKRALRGGEEPLRCWVTGRAAVEPRRLSGMGVAPLSRLFYDSIEEYGGFAPEGVYRRDVPYEKAFDKVWFRSGWSETDDYLLLDGISGGSHSYQDGNCIVRFTSRGRTWFGGVPAAGRLSPGSVREHVGVNIAVDGAGPGCEPRYAALRYVGRGDRFSASGTSMSYPGLADWHRHIVHATDLWFLVVDEIRAKCDGEFLVEAQWHLVGEVALIGDTLHSTQGDAALTMRHAGSGVQDLMPAVLGSEKEGTRWVQRSLGRLREGEGVRFATLFWADRRESVRDYSLSLDSAGYCIADERGSVSVALAHGEEAPELRDDGATLPTPGPVADAGDPTPFQVARREWAPAWRARCEGALTSLATWEEGCCASDAAGGIAAFDREGRLRWRASVQGAVRAVLALQDGGVVAGGDGETVYRLDASGRKVWSQKLVWQPMNWDNWTRMNVQVLSLASGDIDGDGNDEILAGCADRHIY